ncbi:MAG: hypothetical protein ABI840_03820 [bacterium]
MNTIVDDRTILFSHSDSVYHLEDFIGLEINGDNDNSLKDMKKSGEIYSPEQLHIQF